MSAYAARRPLGKGLRDLARAVEGIRQQSLVGGRPLIGRTSGLVLRHASSGPPGASGSPPFPSPRPRPGPRPADRPPPRPRPSPYPRGAPRGAPAGPDTVPGPPNPALGPDLLPDPDGDAGEILDAPSWHLVTQAQCGDAEAFGRLYDRYVDVVYRYVYYRIGDRSTAEDFTSETFLRAWRRIGSVTDQGRDIGAWFVTIARNIVLDHVKSSRYRLEITTADMLDADRHEDGPEGAVLDRIASAELLAAVRRLSAEQQECIVLRFLQGLSVAETAAVMGKNEGAIKALQHRAVRRLATLLPEGFR